MNLRIADVGLASPLGLDAATSCAAARAGISRLLPLRVVNPIAEDYFDGNAVLGHTIPCDLAAGFVGAAKALVLGRLALQDLLSRQPILSDQRARIGFYIVLSDQLLLDKFAALATDNDEEPQEAPSAAWKAQTRNFIDRLLDKCGLSARALQCARVFYGGHSALTAAIQQAMEDLANGSVERCVVGAIDSCVEPRFLRAAAALGMLKTAATAVGLIPGEAAAFLLVDAPETDAGSDKKSLRIASVGTGRDGHDRFSEQPPLGVGLADAITNCFSRIPVHAREDVGLIISDLNGDNYRAVEWGHCLARVPYFRGSLGQQLWLPAVSFGEVGTAAGILAIAMASRASERGYHPGRAAFIVLSSDDGSKAAICVYRDSGAGYA